MHSGVDRPKPRPRWLHRIEQKGEPDRQCNGPDLDQVADLAGRGVVVIVMMEKRRDPQYQGQEHEERQDDW